MIKRANERGFCKLVKELKEELRMTIKAFFMEEMFLYVCLLVLADRCVMQVYLRKLPVVFDILNGHHEYELGTFTFSPFSDSRLFRKITSAKQKFRF